MTKFNSRDGERWNELMELHSQLSQEYIEEQAGLRPPKEAKPTQRSAVWCRFGWHPWDRWRSHPMARHALDGSGHKVEYQGQMRTCPACGLGQLNELIG